MHPVYTKTAQKLFAKRYCSLFQSWLHTIL